MLFSVHLCDNSYSTVLLTRNSTIFASSHFCSAYCRAVYIFMLILSLNRAALKPYPLDLCRYQKVNFSFEGAADTAASFDPSQTQTNVYWSINSAALACDTIYTGLIPVCDIRVLWEGFVILRFRRVARLSLRHDLRSRIDTGMRHQGVVGGWETIMKSTEYDFRRCAQFVIF